MKTLHKKGLHMSLNRLQVTLNTLKGYMIILLDTGFLILLLSYLLVGVSVGFLFLAFCHILTTLRKALLTLYRKLTGYQC
jgi:hypothetical protein